MAREFRSWERFSSVGRGYPDVARSHLPESHLFASVWPATIVKPKTGKDDPEEKQDPNAGKDCSKQLHPVKFSAADLCSP
jgi:hypothetical protein